MERWDGLRELGFVALAKTLLSASDVHHHGDHELANSISGDIVKYCGAQMSLYTTGGPLKAASRALAGR